MNNVTVIYIYAFTRAASRPRLSETEPKLFVFETSCYSVCDIGLNPSLRKINVNTVKHVLLYRINSSCKLLLIIIIHVNCGVCNPSKHHTV